MNYLYCYYWLRIEIEMLGTSTLVHMAVRWQKGVGGKVTVNAV